MSYMITHFFDGGTQEQYDRIREAAHSADGSLPPGQLHHFAGPADGGFLVVAVWDTKESNDAFQQKLGPVIAGLEDGPPPPQERATEVTYQASA
jgi:hypothetical protein